MKKPIYNVSIICANYNNGRYLDAFIQSIIESDVLPFELIVVDDGSTDDSLQILAQHEALPFLKVISFEKNKGFAKALNTALEMACGSYIMRADPDDLFLPQRIARQIDYMEAHPEIDILGSNVAYFQDHSGTIINKSNFPVLHSAILERYKRGEHGIQHPTACIKAEVFKQFRYTPGITPSEDYDIFSRMAIKGFKFANLKEVLYQMRVHQGSMTSNTTLKTMTQTFACRDSIWKKKTNQIFIFFYYLHILYYRKYQLSNHRFIKYFYLLISALCYPRKVLNRLGNLLR